MHVYKMADSARRVFAIMILVWSSVSGIFAHDDLQRWSRAINEERIPRKGEIRAFELGIVRQEESRLVGEFVLAQTGDDGRKHAPLPVEGYKDQDGTFWPSVQLQVSDAPNGGWKTVASSSNGSVPARVVVHSGATLHGMHVKLDPLQPLIGKHKFGRVVLKTGEAAVFQLSLLAPPSETNKPKQQ